MKAVFFDAGGTLVHIDHVRVASVIGRVLGREFSPADFLAAEYSGRDAVERAMAEGLAPSDSSRWTIHFKHMLSAVGISEPEFAVVGGAIGEEHKKKHLWTATLPGTAEALASLVQAGWIVGCISNADGRIEALLEMVGLRSHLSVVIDSGTVGIEKPDPRIFAMALEQTGIASQDAYYVGDIHPVDVAGALAAGMIPVLLDPLGRYGSRGCRTATDVPSFCRELVSRSRAA